LFSLSSARPSIVTNIFSHSAALVSLRTVPSIRTTSGFAYDPDGGINIGVGGSDGLLFAALIIKSVSPATTIGKEVETKKKPNRSVIDANISDFDECTNPPFFLRWLFEKPTRFFISVVLLPLSGPEREREKVRKFDPIFPQNSRLKMEKK